MIKQCLAFLVLIMFMSDAHGQFLIQGILLEKNAKTPVVYANVWVDRGEGTASDENGHFHLVVPDTSTNKKIYISSIGYRSLSFSVDSLVREGERTHIIRLLPFVKQLDEVIIETKRLSPQEIVMEAIKAIPTNYIQKPFNMEFYSRIITRDSVKVLHTVETIARGYREGYKENAQNITEVIQKRVSGKAVITSYDKKRKMEYFRFEMLPMFDVFLVDMIGAGDQFNYSVFGPKYFKKLEFKQKGRTQMDADPVAIIEYDQRNFKKDSIEVKLYGALYISLKDFAILKHVRKIGKNYLEINYKNQGGHYFPYFIKTNYPVNKMPNRTFAYEITHEAFVKKIVTDPVKAITRNLNWHLEDTPFDKDFWNKHYPSK